VGGINELEELEEIWGGHCYNDDLDRASIFVFTSRQLKKTFE